MILDLGSTLLSTTLLSTTLLSTTLLLPFCLRFCLRFLSNENGGDAFVMPFDVLVGLLVVAGEALVILLTLRAIHIMAILGCGPQRLQSPTPVIAIQAFGL